MVKAIIFDMGGVLILNEIKKVYTKLAELIGIDGNTLAEFIWDKRQQFMDGTYSTEDFCLLIKKQFKIDNEGIRDIENK